MKTEILSELVLRYPSLQSCSEAIRKLVDLLIQLYQKDGTLFLCGNGGSASDAEHIAGELLKGFRSKRPLTAREKATFRTIDGGADLADKLQRGLRAVSLLSHPALLSAFGNDVDPEYQFAQHVFALGRQGDVLLGISTSGSSKSVCNALKTAKAIGMRTVLLTGAKHGCCESFADLTIAVPEMETYRIQELHLPIYHAVCAAVESEIFTE